MRFIQRWIITYPKKRFKRFVEAVFYLCRTGCQIRMLPEKYGNCFSIYQKFFKWKNEAFGKLYLNIFRKSMKNGL
ncbi:MAG: transposase [Holosporaceae bacterium]|nr:transposase [Holosporaceae bacterium]